MEITQDVPDCIQHVKKYENDTNPPGEERGDEFIPLSSIYLNSSWGGVKTEFVF